MLRRWVVTFLCFSSVLVTAPEVDSVMQYRQAFVHAAAVRGVAADRALHIPILLRSARQMNALLPGTVGICESRKFYSAIYIDREYWNTQNEISREILVFHELGHCILQQMHTTASVYNPRLELACPGSLMNPSIIPENCYIWNRAWYLDRLFEVMPRD